MEASVTPEYVSVIAVTDQSACATNVVFASICPKFLSCLCSQTSLLILFVIFCVSYRRKAVVVKNVAKVGMAKCRISLRIKLHLHGHQAPFCLLGIKII